MRAPWAQATVRVAAPFGCGWGSALKYGLTRPANDIGLPPAIAVLHSTPLLDRHTRMTSEKGRATPPPSGEDARRLSRPGIPCRRGIGVRGARRRPSSLTKESERGDPRKNRILWDQQSKRGRLQENDRRRFSRSP